MKWNEFDKKWNDEDKNSQNENVKECLAFNTHKRILDNLIF